MARWLLAQVAYQALRKDARLREWFKQIKRRRGATIAGVAVMRKLATIIWHMLRNRKTYAECREFCDRLNQPAPRRTSAPARQRGRPPPPPRASALASTRERGDGPMRGRRRRG